MLKDSSLHIFLEIGARVKTFLRLSHLYTCMIDTCKHSNAMAFSLGLSPWGQKASTLQSCVDKSCFFLLLDSFALAQWSNHLVHSRGFPLLIYHITQIPSSAHSMILQQLLQVYLFIQQGPNFTWLWLFFVSDPFLEGRNTIHLML